MKLLMTLCALLSSSIAFAATPIKTYVPIEKVYAPAGFHDHQESEVIISGYLPNLCHKSPTTEVEIVGGQIQISVKAMHYLPSNPMCAPVLVPFVESVDVGLLDKGLYEIVVNPNTPFERGAKLGVEDFASSAIGDAVFANVHQVENIGQDQTVLLKGYNPSDCYELDQISYIHNNDDTYSVYPKMRQVSAFCPQKMTPFSYEFRVPEDLRYPKVLLHVRAMDGRSVNYIYGTSNLFNQ